MTQLLWHEEGSWGPQKRKLILKSIFKEYLKETLFINVIENILKGHFLFTLPHFIE